MTKPGDVLLVRWNNRRNGEPSEIGVVTVGRKWIHLQGGYRLEIGKRELDGGEYSSPGRVYFSREQYDSETAAERTWRAFRDATVSHWSPPRMNQQVIRDAAELLGLTLKGLES